MVIKYTSAKDKQCIKDIWSICFPEDHEPFLSWFFDNVYEPSNTLAAYEDNSIVANLQLIPYTISFHNIPLIIRYLVGAATLPEFRMKGIMAQLLRTSIREARNIDCPFILLLPFNYAFYRKFGWETCYFHNQYNTNLSNIKKYSENTGKVLQISAHSYISILDNIYTNLNSNKNGWVLRTNSDWSNLIQDHLFNDGLVALYYDDTGFEAGYVIYKINDCVIEIVELAYINNKAAISLMQFIAAQIEITGRLLWKAPADDISYMFFENPRSTCSIEPFVMVRAVDVYKILQLLTLKLTVSFSLYLNIEDPLASWNNGVFHIFKVPNKTAEIDKVSYNSSLKEVVTISINTFSMLSMGIISPLEAQEHDLINISNQAQISALGEIFKKTINFMNEYF